MKTGAVEFGPTVAVMGILGSRTSVRENLSVSSLRLSSTMETMMHAFLVLEEPEGTSVSGWRTRLCAVKPM